VKQSIKHPAIVQLRGVNNDLKEDIVKHAKDFEVEVEFVKNGLDIYFSDVNDARTFISKLKKLYRFDMKFSTKYAGLRKGRVRVLFVYCLRFKD